MKFDSDRTEALFEAVPEPMVLVGFSDDTPVVRACNDTFIKQFGYAVESVSGESLNKFIVPEDDNARQTAIEIDEAAAAGRTIERTVTRQTAEGKRNFLFRAAPFEEQDTVKSLGIYIDITDRHQERERYEALIQHSTDIITILDPDGTIRYESPSVKRILGHEPGQLVGESAFDYIHPDDREKVIEEFERSLKNRDLQPEVEYRFKATDGSWRWLASTGSNHIDSQPIRGYVVNSRDITERKEREQKLQRQRNRYQSLFENNPLIIWEEDYSAAIEYLESIASDVNNVESYLLENPQEIDQLMEQVEIIDVNQNAVEYYDAPSKDVLLENVDQVFPEEAVGALAAEWAAIAAGQRRFRTETVSQTFSDEKTNVLLDVFVPESHAEDYSRVYVIATDITEAKERERRLKQQNERLDKFASVVSHDLRNPLNVASARLELAADECDSTQLQEVADAHERMERLIEDLLTFARAGSEAIDRRTVALDHLLAECWEGLRTGNATLTVETEQAIRADRGRLRQLLENLLRNAFEHGGADVSISVGSLEEGFYVEDDGPGIPEDERTDVFDAGYSASQQGTGFGLSIVKQVAEAHGWDIRVTDSDDGGARFEVTGIETLE